MEFFKYKTIGNVYPQGKPKVYFSSHPDDFERYFDTIYNFVKLSEGEERCSDIIYRLLTKLISNYNKIS